jgi:hypothetical protein
VNRRNLRQNNRSENGHAKKPAVRSGANDSASVLLRISLISLREYQFLLSGHRNQEARKITAVLAVPSSIHSITLREKLAETFIFQQIQEFFLQEINAHYRFDGEFASTSGAIHQSPECIA